MSDTDTSTATDEALPAGALAASGDTDDLGADHRSAGDSGAGDSGAGDSGADGPRSGATAAGPADPAAAASDAGSVGDAGSGDDDSSGDSAGEEAGSGDRAGADGLLVQEGDIAADYLERLLDIVDYDGDIDLDVENDRAVVAIVGGDLRPLVGPRGETLDALQELTRLAVQQQTGARSRLMLDVSGHRAARRVELRALATDTAATVRARGESVRLSPMNPFERKVVHDAVAELDGVRSESEGEEPHRRVVVLPAS